MAQPTKIRRLTITDEMIVAGMRKAHEERSKAFMEIFHAAGRGISHLFAGGRKGQTGGIPQAS